MSTAFKAAKQAIRCRAEREEAVMQGLCDALPGAAFSGPESHQRITLGGVTVCLRTIAARVIERLDEQAAT